MQQSSGLGRGLVVTSAAVVVLAGMSAARDVVGPLLMGLFFAIIFSPVRSWLVRKGVPGGLALGLIALALVGVIGFLGLLVAISAGQLLANLDQYQALLAQRLSGIGAALSALGVGAPAGDATGVESSQLMGLLSAIVGAAAGAGWNFFQLLLLLLFLMVDGEAILGRARAAFGGGHPFLTRLGALGPQMVRFFGLRTYLNALTGLGVAGAFLFLGVDYAPLWGVLMFFMSYVPYIGIFVAAVPPVILAFAEFGAGRALLVVVLITVVNVALENVVMPRLIGRQLSMPAILVFFSFFFWSFLLGPAGALLAMFLTILVLMLLDSFPESRWIPQALGASSETVTTTPLTPAAAPARREG
jgi:AI-2 transport protein TqsA